MRGPEIEMRVLVAVEEIALRARVERIIASCGGDAIVGAAPRGPGEPGVPPRPDVAVVAPASADDRDLALARALCGRGARVIVLARSREDMRGVARALPDVAVLLSQPLDDKGLARLLSQAVAAGPDKAPGPTTLLTFEGGSVDLGGRTFCNADGGEVPLTHREFELLALLARCSGRALSRDQLHNATSGRGHEPYDRSIDMLVARLRRKVEPDSKRPRYILTVPGVGYKFGARVHQAERQSTVPLVPPTETTTATRPPERRQLTVLACQIEGLAVLSSTLDPEDEGDLMASVQRTCAEVAAQFRGVVTGILGDTVLVHFGYKEAQEHDPERAVRAGLALVHATRNLGRGALRPRIGIATGLMLVAASPGPQDEAVATGWAVNLALHLRSVAPADGVLVTGRTRELVGDFFTYEEMEPLVLADDLAPIPIWRVAAEKTNTGRFEALRRAGMLELVGRRQELELLRRRWGYALAGAGQVVLVSGEPGIGKSRLVAEFQEESDAGLPGNLKYFGSPDQTDAALFPVIEELQRAAGFDRADSSSRRMAKLTALLEQPGGATDSEGVSLI